MKNSLGIGGATRFAVCDAPICPAVRTIGWDDATRAKTRFSRWPNFRAFQHNPSIRDVRLLAMNVARRVELTRSKLLSGTVCPGALLP